MRTTHSYFPPRALELELIVLLADYFQPYCLGVVNGAIRGQSGFVHWYRTDIVMFCCHLVLMSSYSKDKELQYIVYQLFLGIVIIFKR